MKYLLTGIFLLTISFASAQIVNIPDPGFKQDLINNGVDINHDGDIQVSEALIVTALTIQSAQNLTGIQSFSNLDSLNTYHAPLSVLNLDNMLKLKYLKLPGYNSSISISLTNCHNLKYLDVSLNLFTPALDLSSCDSLSTIDFGPGLMSQSDIGTLNISGLTKLDSLYEFGWIGNLIATNCTGLKVIETDKSTDIRYLLDVTGCINLTKIYVLSIGHTLTTLDLSSCTSLDNFSITTASHIENLNIKNGRMQTFRLTAGNPTVPYVINICADEFEIASISNYLLSQTWNGIPSYIVNINSYCSFLPGGNYNTIKGTVRMDLNNNGCDNADPGAGYVPVKFTDTSGTVVFRNTDGAGNYIFYPYKGLFTIAPYFPYAYFTVTPSSSIVSFDTANSIINTSDFCISPTGIHNDLEINFLPLGPARSGFTAMYMLNYKNRGTTTLSGNVQLNFDNTKMNFSSAFPVSPTQTTGQLTWNFSNLHPFESQIVYVSLNLLSAPVNNIGDTLTYLATINPTTGDETPYDNSFILPQRVTVSFDPNDKQCIEGSKITFADIDKYLHYIVHFQNLGNDTAFNIVVVDTLSDKMDWNSVEIIGSSHTCDVKETNGKLEFFFRDIKLPYKAINEQGSTGFIAFKVKPKSTVTIGDSLNNRAGIYFDFNPPIMTNTTTTVVSLVSPIPVKLEYFSGSKKNETNVLTWKAPSTNGSTNFNIERSADGIHFTSIANIDATTERCQSPFNFTDNNPLPGKNYYRLKITDVDRIVFYSKILLLENNKTGIEILSIVSTKENTIVNFNSDKQQTIQLNVIAADGRLIYNNSTIISAGNNNVNLKLNKMATGIYTLIIYTSGGEIITRRFIK